MNVLCYNVFMEDITQQEVLDLFLSKPRKVYKKFPIVAWRPVVPGETVIVTCGGRIETIQHPDQSDIVIKAIETGTSAETYVIKSVRFAERYKHLENEAMNIEGKRWERAQAIGKVEGFEYKGDTLRFEAPWGEKMLLEDGYMLVKTHGTERDIYRIARPEFDVTYKEYEVSF